VICSRRGHEDADRIGVIEQMVPGFLSRRKAAVAAFVQDIRMTAEVQRRRSLQNEDVLFFGEVVMKSVGVFSRRQLVDAHTHARTPPKAPSNL
jgi:hypothetical protein